jgi:ABC-2 type transport system ATP-binding protein
VIESPIVNACGLTRRFGSLTAVNDLRFTIPSGKIFGFLGPNGAGKTTTIRLLLGLLEPTAGSSIVCGVNPVTAGRQVRHQTGALLEHPGIYERLSGQENLELYGRLSGIPSAVRKPRIEKLLRHFGLWDRRKELAGTWSRGMKQKLAIARAVLHEPPLVFLDEPTAGLDPEAASEVRDDISTMARDSGTTVFLTTHNLSEADRLCDMIGIIRSGKLLACGSRDSIATSISGNAFEASVLGASQQLIAHVQQDSRVAKATFERDRLLLEFRHPTPLPAVVALLAEIGIAVTSVRQSGTALEDLYLRLMKSEQANVE